jgi:protein TonB
VAQPPVLLEQVRPDYPANAKRLRIVGLVRLEAVIDATGAVRDPIRVLASVPELDAAAIAALRRWRFAPARDERGQPVPVIVEVPIRFVLR